MTHLEFDCSDEKAVALLRASRLYDEGVKPAEWISVEDGCPVLPDKDFCYVWVIAYSGYHNTPLPMMYKRTIIRGKRHERWKNSIGSLAPDPDYWMPLPEPPKEE